MTKLTILLLCFTTLLLVVGTLPWKSNQDKRRHVNGARVAAFSKYRSWYNNRGSSNYGVNKRSFSSLWGPRYNGDRALQHFQPFSDPFTDTYFTKTFDFSLEDLTL